MEKRKFKRINLNATAEIKTRSDLYAVSVENISDKGIHLVIPTSAAVEDFIPGSILKINFKAHTGSDIANHYEIKWLKIDTEPLTGLIYNIGLQSITPSPIHDELHMKVFQAYAD